MPQGKTADRAKQRFSGPNDQSRMFAFDPFLPLAAGLHPTRCISLSILGPWSLSRSHALVGGKLTVTGTMSPFRVISNFEVCFCIGAAAAVYFFLDAHGYVGLDVASGAVVGVLISCVGTCWPLRQRPWFWIIGAALVALHLTALFGIDWSVVRNWTGLTIMPFMAADTLATLGVVYVVFRLVCGPPQHLFAPNVSGERGYAERDDC